MQYVWRVTIPEIGYQSPTLMHGLLAAAAMHKAYLLPRAAAQDVPWTSPRTTRMPGSGLPRRAA